MDSVLVFTYPFPRWIPLTLAAAVEIDAKEAIGADKLEWRVIEGGHEFPITRAGEVVKEVWGVWNI